MRILHLLMHAGARGARELPGTLPTFGRPDVTLCTFLPGKLPPSRRLAHREGTGSYWGFSKTVWLLLRHRSFDVIHVHAPVLGLMLLGIILCTRWRLLGRTILHVHGSYEMYGRKDRLALLLLFLCSTRVICCGHTARRSFPRRYRWCAGRRLLTIRHSVDLDLVDRLWPFRPGLDWTEAPPLSLVTIGRLEARKNHATILRALARARSRTARLTVIGDGPLLDSLKALAADLELTARVDFVGALPHQQTLKHLWEADGYISMALAEGLPCGALEAMGCYCPVVLTNIAPHREIRGRRTDLIPLLPATDVRALARAIDTWDMMPADVRRCWGADCRLHMESRFALTRTLQKIDQLYAQFLPASSPEWELFCRCVRQNTKRRKAA